MKEKILNGALVQFGLAAFIGILLVLLRSFDSIENLEYTARFYTVAVILGVTGICTGLIGTVYPKKGI